MRLADTRGGGPDVASTSMRRQESGRQYTTFVDSTAAAGRVRTDALGLGQRLAISTAEVCARIRERPKAVTIR